MENKTVEMVVKDLFLADNQKKKEEEAGGCWSSLFSPGLMFFLTPN